MSRELETLPADPGRALETLLAEDRDGETERGSASADASASLAEDRTVLAGSGLAGAGSGGPRSAGSLGASRGSGKPTPVGPGARVGRYVLIEEVGRGAMGVVLAAYDPQLDRKVAVKLLIEDSHADGQAQAGLANSLAHRSLAEAKALARLNHPNVVKVYDAGEEHGRVFMAMEFVVGQPLGDWRERTKPPLPLVLDVFRKAALGLAAAHAASLVHRDFKPDNVMIADDGRVLVMDFGLAVARHGSSGGGSGASESTSVGKFWASGTPAYMSPEQFANAEVGPKSDQFGFFVALYEALGGQRPFQGDSLASLAAAVSEGRLHDPNGLRASPAWLRRLVTRGLALDPAERHASMEVVAEQLAAGIARRGRTLRLAALALVAVTGVASWAWLSSREDPELAQCLVAADGISADWAERWKQDNEARFVAALAADGPRLWQRVAADVDGFAAAWTSHYAGACTDRHVGESIVAAEFDGRIRCLADQRAYVASLLEMTATDDPAKLREIAAVIAELPRPAACEGDRQAAGDFDQGAHEQVAAARRELMRARGRTDAGDNAGGQVIAQAALDGLTDIDAPVTQAELLALLGKIAYDEGALEDGDRALREALEQAARSHDPRLIAELWVDRVVLLISASKDYTRSEHLLEAAEVAVAAVPDGHEMRSDLASIRGMIALEAGRTSDAREAFAAALALAEQHQLGPRVLARHHKRLGAAEAKLSNLAAARRAFTRALELSASLFGEGHVSVVGDYSNLGLLSRQEGDDAAARVYFGKAIALASPTQPGHARASVYLGQLEADAGNLDEAERLALVAVAIYEAAFGPLHPDLTAPRLLLSLVYRKRGDLDGAHAQALKLVEIAEHSTPEGHPKRAIAHTGLGEVLLARGQLEPALAQFELALSIRRAALDPGDERIGYSLAARANVLAQLERDAEALTDANAAMALFDATSGNDSWRAGVRFTIARVSRDRAAAITRAQEALAIYEQLGTGEEAEVERVRAWLAEREPSRE